MSQTVAIILFSACAALSTLIVVQGLAGYMLKRFTIGLGEKGDTSPISSPKRVKELRLPGRLRRSTGDFVIAPSRKPKRPRANGSGHFRLEFGDCGSAFCLPVDTPAREPEHPFMPG